jgi:DNA-binding transcriptional LysR family regulator
MEEHSGDMIEERLDLAVRSGEVTSPSLIVRNLGTLTRIAVAAPLYPSTKRNTKPALLAMRHGCRPTTSSLHDTHNEHPNFDTPLLSGPVSIVAGVGSIGIPAPLPRLQIQLTMTG